MDQGLVPAGGGALRPADGSQNVSLAEMIKAKTPRQVTALVAELRASLEHRLGEFPDDYGALTLLGELKLRVGLASQARELLYKASLLPPPTWEAFQRTSYLLRRAEEQETRSFERFSGAPPPRFLLRLGSTLARKLSKHSVELAETR